MSLALARLTILFSLVLFGTSGCNSPSQNGSDLEALLSQDSITIAVTDSGLGGLSVVADAVRKLKADHVFGNVKLVFYNALFTPEGGYNSLSGRDEKVQIFSRALQGLQDRYSPDVILVACNTLSVLYPDTDFAATTEVPVLGIVEGGVDLIADRMKGDDPGHTIIFATETTIDEGTHKAALIDDGIPAGRIVTQKCPQLASYIEQGFDGMETEFLIDAYVDEAMAVVGDLTGPLYVSFNCTHYGYSLAAWQAAFAARGVEVEEYLDPNRTMIDSLLPVPLHNRCETVSVSVRVVSMVEIPVDRRASIGRYLQEISPATASALDDYELVPDLFAWTDLTAGEAR